MSIVQVHNNARQDLLAIKKLDKRAAAALLLMIEELQADNAAYLKLCTEGEHPLLIHRFTVSEWRSAQPLPLARVRFLDNPATPYRIIYGKHPNGDVTLLSIVKKDEYNYDDLSSPENRRILSAWAETDTQQPPSGA